MPITIAGVSHETSRPADLDVRLVATTGCSAAELRQALPSMLAPGIMAAAVLPFLAGADVPDVVAIGRGFAGDLAEDAGATIARVVELLAEPHPSVEAPEKDN